MIEETVIETFDLTKIYRMKNKNIKTTAVNKANLKVFKGEILGLLGPNGAGKTTFLELLCTLKTPTSGYALVNGEHILKRKREVKNSISLMLGNSMLYYNVTGRDNLRFFSKMYEIKDYRNRIENLIKDFDFSRWIDEYIEFYSTGMKMILSLMRTLIIDRQILFLDEPTVGLDPKVTKFIVKKIKSLRNLNKTIILTTHQMQIANTLSDRIALIKNGVFIEVDTVENIKKLITDRLIIDISVKQNKEQLITDLKGQNFVIEIIENGDKNYFRIHVKNNDYYQQLLNIVKNYKILKFQEIEPSLDDVFTKLL